MLVDTPIANSYLWTSQFYEPVYRAGHRRRAPENRMNGLMVTQNTQNHLQRKSHIKWKKAPPKIAMIITISQYLRQKQTKPKTKENTLGLAKKKKKKFNTIFTYN